MIMTKFIATRSSPLPPAQPADVLAKEMEARVNSWYTKLAPWGGDTMEHTAKLGILSLILGIPPTHWVSLSKSLDLSGL